MNEHQEGHQDERFGALLGSVVIWTIAKGPYASHKVADRLEEGGFEIDIPEATISQAWRRATGEPVPGYTWTTPGGRQTQVTLQKHDVRNNSRRTARREFFRISPGLAPVRVLVAECGRRKKPSARIGFKISLDAANLTSVDERRELVKIRDAMNGRIEELLTDLDGTRVRKVVRAALEQELQGFLMRGGVYYVPRRHTARLKALQAVFEVLPGSDCMVIPMPDLPEQREIVTKLFVEHTLEDVQDYVGLYRAPLERGHCSEYLFEKAQAEAAALQQRTDAYLADLEITDGSDDPVWDALDDLNAAVKALDGVRSRG